MKSMKVLIAALGLAMFAGVASAAPDGDRRVESVNKTYQPSCEVAGERCPACCTNNCKDCSKCKSNVATDKS